MNELRGLDRHIQDVESAYEPDFREEEEEFDQRDYDAEEDELELEEPREPW